MTGGARQGWRSDPYRRHELRYWDGLAWTASVSDVGVVGDDPVFPVPDSDAHDYLARPRSPQRLPGLDRAATWAICGFVGVVALAAASSVDGLLPKAPKSRVATVEAAAAPVTGTHRAQAAPTAPTAPTALAALAPPTAPTAPTARDALAALPVRAAAPVPAGATRPDGDRQSSAGRDGASGCDLRERILRRDLTAVRLAPGGCVVRAGILRDPWSGTTIRYPGRRGGRSPVSVEQVVGAADAWRSGAARLTAAQRRQLATDPLNLLTVSATVRPRAGHAGHADPAGWLPPHRPARCTYAARRIAVKARYHLSVTPAERTLLGGVLSTCPHQPLPTAAEAHPAPAAPADQGRVVSASGERAARPSGGRRAAGRSRAGRLGSRLSWRR